MKQKEIKKLSKEDLEEKLKEFESSLKDLKMKHSISPLENPLEIKKIRRIIARLKTFESNQ
jgi:large subunit ribosomal protein L29|tara:strand:- start:1585 stop:1767 length:183 start_codon:yes stop_codon:yes gene_type:complete